MTSATRTRSSRCEPACTRGSPERLGHANVGITLDTCSHVDLDMQGERPPKWLH